MRKPRTHGEVYNDLDEEVVNVFRVLQDPKKAADLARRVSLTPFSRAEFRAAYQHQNDDLSRAWAMIVRSFMGFGSAAMTRTHVTGFRANSNRSGTIPASDWANWPNQIKLFVSRLRGVVIENRDALQVMQTHDKPSTLHFVDPPYVPSTRTSLTNRNGNQGHYYRHDMDEADHLQLADKLHLLQGMVVLSGYRCELYDDLFHGWQRLDRKTHADGARKRVESIWLNSRSVRGMRQQSIFCDEAMA